jgi:hypothetical protein
MLGEPGAISSKRQVELAKEFLGRMKTSKNPFISGFNSVVAKGPDKVREWYETTGKCLKLESTGVAAGSKGAIKIVEQSQMACQSWKNTRN